MKTLVIDDDLHSAVMIAQTLRQSIVVGETDSARGLARILSADDEGERFELVLCKAAMPGMDGIDILAALRAHHEPPFVILMFDAMDSVQELAAKADGILVKPLTAHDVSNVVGQARAVRSHLKTQRIGRFPLPAR